MITLEQLQLWWRQPTILLLLLPLPISIFFLLPWKWKKNHHSTTTATTMDSKPPSPPKLPIIGNLHHLGAHAHRSLRDLAAIHGPLMLLHLGSVPVLVASTANAAKNIMKTHDLSFCSRPRLIAGERLMYNFKDMSFAPYGEYWRQVRRLCVLHLLSPRRARSARAAREDEVANMMAKISNSATALSLSEMLIELTNDITCRVALGRRYWREEVVVGGGGGRGRGLQELLHEFLELLGAFNVADFIPSLAWLNRWNGFDARIEKNSRELDRFLESVVDDHLVHGGGGGVVEGDKNNSFVDVLLSLQKDHSMSEFSMDRDSIKALILDMFAAGTHTTFTVIDWAMTELMRHPEAMKKAQQEAREAGRGKPMVVEDDIEHMSYLKMVIKEVLRLHPPIPLLVPRESIEDVELQGYHIPKKTRVIINAWAIQMDHEVWESPEEFRPERFADGPEVDYKGLDFQLIPFGAGRRGCPGIHFAEPIIELALANLLYGFEWELPDGIKGEDLDMEEAIGISANRKDSLVLVARPH